MRASRNLWFTTCAAVAALATTALAPRPARACGPDFPSELLDDRDDTLLTLQEGFFLDEVTRLVAAPPYTVVIVEDPDVRRHGTDLERTLYATGAAAFHAGDRDAATRAFEELLRLPPAVRHTTSTWAAYSLARLRDGDDAIATYRQVRALTDAGFADELGLASASLGQEARLLWDRGAPGDAVHAIHLYALQAALGGSGGDTSLLFIARELATHEHAFARGAEAGARLDEVLAAPLGQRLMATYLATRGDELDGVLRADLWQRLTAIVEHSATPMPGADQLAVDAYRQGAWALAATFAASAPDAPRARWVEAKLALRAGDRATAERLLAAADAGLAADPTAASRLGGERAALALADGRATDAMELTWRIRDTHPDAVYVAERVLTIDELTAFVAKVAPTRAAPPPPPDAPDAYDTWGLATPSLLRDILGRRLMRAGRFGEAYAYLPPEHLLDAWHYASAIARTSAADPIDRAAAFHDASLIARRRGLELLGTSHAPDWGLYDAQYDPYAWRAWSDEPPPPRSRFRSAAEDDRVAASAPVHAERYHYRFIASDQAEAAANLLPHQSQAFATTLCLAAQHIFYRDEDRKNALYERYLSDGPMYSMNFGQGCPAPEFERARRFLPPPPEPRWPLAVIGGLCALGLVLLMRRLRPGRIAMRP